VLSVNDMKEKFFLAIIIFGLMWGGSALAWQVETIADLPAAGDFLVFPAKKEIIMAGGAQEKVEISILNRTGKAQEYTLEVNDLKGSQENENGLEFGDYASYPYSLKKYLRTVDNQVVIGSGQLARAQLEISLPEEMPPGGLYAIILISQHSVGDSAGEAKMIGQAGIPIYVKIPGKVVESGATKSFKIDLSALAQRGVGLKIYFQNDGNIYLAPKGQIEISDIFGRLVAKKDIPQFYSLPGSYKMVRADWQNTADVGYYRAVAKVQRGYAGPDGLPLSDQLSGSFWILSQRAKITLIGILALVVGVLLFLKIKHARKKFQQ